MGLEDRPLGGDDREVVDRQPLLTAVQAEHLAEHTEFEGVDFVQQQDGDVFQHGASVAGI